MLEVTKRKRQTVLVVDDEPGTVEVLVSVLTDAGYRVTGAVNGRDALQCLQEERCDLILLDLMMPVLDGAATLAAMKESKRLAGIAVVMMSGLPEPMVKRRARGYDAFLRKPFALDELLETVRAALVLLERRANKSRPSKKPRRRRD